MPVSKRKPVLVLCNTFQEFEEFKERKGDKNVTYHFIKSKDDLQKQSPKSKYVIYGTWYLREDYLYLSEWLRENRCEMIADFS